MATLAEVGAHLQMEIAKVNLVDHFQGVVLIR